jgi:hypothetical protein
MWLITGEVGSVWLAATAVSAEGAAAKVVAGSVAVTGGAGSGEK